MPPCGSRYILKHLWPWLYLCHSSCTSEGIVAQGYVHAGEGTPWGTCGCGEDWAAAGAPWSISGYAWGNAREPRSVWLWISPQESRYTLAGLQPWVRPCWSSFLSEGTMAVGKTMLDRLYFWRHRGPWRRPRWNRCSSKWLWLWESMWQQVCVTYLRRLWLIDKAALGANKPLMNCSLTSNRPKLEQGQEFTAMLNLMAWSEGTRLEIVVEIPVRCNLGFEMHVVGSTTAGTIRAYGGQALQEAVQVVSCWLQLNHNSKGWSMEWELFFMGWTQQQTYSWQLISWYRTCTNGLSCVIQLPPLKVSQISPRRRNVSSLCGPSRSVHQSQGVTELAQKAGVGYGVCSLYLFIHSFFLLSTLWSDFHYIFYSTTLCSISQSFFVYWVISSGSSFSCFYFFFPQHFWSRKCIKDASSLSWTLKATVFEGLQGWSGFISLFGEEDRVGLACPSSQAALAGAILNKDYNKIGAV